MSEACFDVIVAGGGPVGWACALAAQSALGKKARVAVVERDALPAISAGDPLSPRVYTVAAGNLAWLAGHGVLFDASRSAAVTDILVCGRNGTEALHVTALEAGQDDLAQVMEHEALTLAIATRAQKNGVHLIAGECVARHDGDAVLLVELADRRILQGRILLAADGAHSRLRNAQGMSVIQRTYPQHGVVAHLICAAPHRGTARQWFLPDGSILALLPLPDIRGEPALSMVWSVTPTRADALCAMTQTDLLGAISAASGGQVCASRIVDGTRRFPLGLLRLANPVADRFIAVGDAAHTLHPLAGQGVNVGLVDARCLQSMWLRSDEVHDDPGHALLLSRYRRERYGPTLAMQLATDGLFRLYNQPDHPWLMAAGDAGMRLFGRLPAFRRTLSTAALQ